MLPAGGSVSTIAGGRGWGVNVGAGVEVAVDIGSKNLSCNPAGRLQAMLIIVISINKLAAKRRILVFGDFIGRLPFVNKRLKQLEFKAKEIIPASSKTRLGRDNQATIP